MGMLGAAFAALTATLSFPSGRRGPARGMGLLGTAFPPRVRLVTAAGAPLPAEDMVIGAVITV